MIQYERLNMYHWLRIWQFSFMWTQPFDEGYVWTLILGFGRKYWQHIFRIDLGNGKILVSGRWTRKAIREAGTAHERKFG